MVILRDFYRLFKRTFVMVALCLSFGVSSSFASNNFTMRYRCVDNGGNVSVDNSFSDTIQNPYDLCGVNESKWNCSWHIPYHCGNGYTETYGYMGCTNSNGCDVTNQIFATEDFGQTWSSVLPGDYMTDSDCSNISGICVAQGIKCLTYDCAANGGTVASNTVYASNKDCVEEGESLTVRAGNDYCLVPNSDLVFNYWQGTGGYFGTWAPNVTVQPNTDVSLMAVYTARCPITYYYGPTCQQKYYNADFDPETSTLPNLSSLPNYSSCVGSDYIFEGWDCSDVPLTNTPTATHSTITCEKGDCGDDSHSPVYPAGYHHFNFYHHNFSDVNDCYARCSAIIKYPVRYICGEGGPEVFEDKVAYGDSYTFADENVCSAVAPYNSTFNGWFCTNGVGYRNSGDNLPYWNMQNGIYCTAQWELTCDPNIAIDINETISESFQENQNLSDEEPNKGYIDGFGNELNSSDFGLSDLNTWSVKFDNGNIISGNANCNVLDGELYDNAQALSPSEGVNCWCNATSYTQKDNDPQTMVSHWVYTEKFENINDCKTSCAIKCTDDITGLEEFREVLYSYGQICDNISGCRIEYQRNKDLDDTYCATGPGKVDYITDSSYTILSLSNANISETGNCEFVGWESEDSGILYSEGEELKEVGDNLEECNEKLILVAQWAPKHTVTYNPGSAGASGGKTVSVTSGTQYTFLDFSQANITPPTGMVLDYWDCTPFNPSVVMPGDKKTITSDVICTAQWTKFFGYTVSYSCVGGSGIAPIDNNTYTYNNQNATIKTNTCDAPENASFGGWYCNGVYQSPNSVLNVYSLGTNVECTARWLEDTLINLIWNGNQATVGPVPEENTCVYGGNITLPTTPTRTGHRFTGWKLVNWAPVQ